MDIATIVGLLAAFGLIFMAISENAPAFVDTASLLIVVAGSIAVVMARCSLGEFLGAVARAKVENHARLVCAKVSELLVCHIHLRMNGQPARSRPELAIGLEPALNSLVDRRP